MSNNENKIVDLRPLSCPFISGVAVSPQGVPAAITLPCSKEKCAVWDAVNNMCSVLSLAGNADNVHSALSAIRCEISNLRMVFTPPKDSPSPLMRIAESLETLVKLEKTAVSLKIDDRHRGKKG